MTKERNIQLFDEAQQHLAKFIDAIDQLKRGHRDGPVGEALHQVSQNFHATWQSMRLARMRSMKRASAKAKRKS